MVSWKRCCRSHVLNERLPVLAAVCVSPTTGICREQADNVGSNQMAKIRFALRGQATVLMGKNTMIRKIISTYVREHPGHPFELVRRELKRLLAIVSRVDRFQILR